MAQEAKDFKYASVTDAGVSASGWSAFNVNGWMWLTPTAQAGQRMHRGWKLHLSVAADQVPRVWDLLQATLRSQGMSAKVAGPAFALECANADHPQAGRSLTLWSPDLGQGDPARWQSIITTIERLLGEHEIDPGPDVPGNRPITGSAYMSYRHDGRERGLTGTAAVYNPGSQRGSLHDVKLPGRAHLAPRDDNATGRRLNQVIGGWQWNASATGWQGDCSSLDAAIAVERALDAAGVHSGRHRTRLYVNRTDGAAVAAGWHRAREVMMALDIGRTVQDGLQACGAHDARLSIRPRTADGHPPRVRLANVTEDLAIRAADLLSDIIPLVRSSGSDIFIPYGGHLHESGPLVAQVESVAETLSSLNWTREPKEPVQLGLALSM